MGGCPACRVSQPSHLGGRGGLAGKGWAGFGGRRRLRPPVGGPGPASRGAPHSELLPQSDCSLLSSPLLLSVPPLLSPLSTPPSIHLDRPGGPCACLASVPPTSRSLSPPLPCSAAHGVGVRGASCHGESSLGSCCAGPRQPAPRCAARRGEPSLCRLGVLGLSFFLFFLFLLHSG